MIHRFLNWLVTRFVDCPDLIVDWEAYKDARVRSHDCNCGNPEPHTDHEGDTV